MCGICGEVRFDGRPVRRRDIVAMRDQLVHRGPDSDGVFVSPGGQAGLGFRRLRIIDLTANASQPMPNEDGDVQVVFNGEIYNFQTLRRDLEARGHRFRSRSDTETIVHLYEEKGPACVADLDGMFAIALWDERTRRLTLARDRVGKKPLFCYLSDRFVAFGSEIKALFAHHDVEIEIDPTRVPAFFLYGYVPNPATLYRRIVQIEPGTYVTIEADGARTSSHRYWQIAFPRAGEGAPIGHDEAVAGVRERVTRAVERRLVSDVPLGAFLSGGIDSTIVVGLMRRLTGAPVKTFSIGFEGDAAYDETAFARIAARRFDTDHTEFRVTPDTVNLIDSLVWHHDGPFGDSSAVPTAIVSRLTREHVTVVLTGDGGDEVFAGYDRFWAALAAQRIPRGLARLASVLASLVPAPHERHWLAKMQRFAAGASRPLHERVTMWNAVVFDGLASLVRPELLPAGGVDPLQHLASQRTSLDGRSPLSQLLLANFVSYLPDDLLVKTDRCTMAHSLEARSPFLDRELIEFVALLPDAMKLDGRRTKAVLRDAFADLLPPEISARPKMGFGVPLSTWFRGQLRDYVRDVLLNPDARYRTMLSERFVGDLLGRHLDGRVNAGPQLWTLIVFERWLQLLPEWQRQGRAASEQQDDRGERDDRALLHR